MNKKWLITAGAVAGVLGLGVFQTSADSVEPALESENIKSQIEMEYPGTITEFELEEEDGRAVYEIEIEGDRVEYEVKVDGDTGEVLKDEKKRHEQKPAENTSNQEEPISLEEAKEIALDKFEGTLKEVEYEKDDGRYVYEIEVKNGKEEADIEIDAATGKIIEFEMERDLMQ